MGRRARRVRHAIPTRSHRKFNAVSRLPAGNCLEDDRSPAALLCSRTGRGANKPWEAACGSSRLGRSCAGNNTAATSAAAGRRKGATPRRGQIVARSYPAAADSRMILPAVPASLRAEQQSKPRSRSGVSSQPSSAGRSISTPRALPAAGVPARDGPNPLAAPVRTAPVRMAPPPDSCHRASESASRRRERDRR
jgi:hypothetical protein